MNIIEQFNAEEFSRTGDILASVGISEDLIKSVDHEVTGDLPNSLMKKVTAHVRSLIKSKDPDPILISKEIIADIIHLIDQQPLTNFQKGVLFLSVSTRLNRSIRQYLEFLEEEAVRNLFKSDHN